ncbi:MAG: GNAT family N-acetyltransferase [Tahibacter sp.]
MPELCNVYFIRSARLGFRQWRPTDLDLAISLWADANVTHLIGGPFAETAIRQRLDEEMRMQRERGVQYWPLFLLESGEFAGCCGLRHADAREPAYELGFHLHRQQWGKGLASEAAARVIAHAKESLSLAAIFAGHHPENGGSRRILAQLGFIGTGDEYYAPTGLRHPSYRLDLCAGTQGTDGGKMPGNAAIHGAPSTSCR